MMTSGDVPKDEGDNGGELLQLSPGWFFLSNPIKTLRSRSSCQKYSYSASSVSMELRIPNETTIRTNVMLYEKFARKYNQKIFG